MRTSPTRTPDMNLTKLMARQNKPILVCTGSVFLAVVIVLDKVSPPGFEVSVFYLVPVSRRAPAQLQQRGCCSST